MFAMAESMSTEFRRRGYSRAILDAANHKSSQSTATRTRWRRAPAWCWRGRTLTVVEERFSRSITSRRNSDTNRSMGSCSTSVCHRCKIDEAGAASRSGSTAVSTCGWAATDRARPRVAKAPSVISPTSSSSSARSGIPAASPRHHRRAQRRAITTTKALAAIVERVVYARRTGFIRQPDVQALRLS